MKAFKVKLNIIPIQVEKQIIEELSEENNYGKIDSKFLKKLKKKFNVSKRLIISLRSQFLKNKNIKRHFLIKNKLSEIKKVYNSTDILKISKEFDFSPMSIMRLLIKDKYGIKVNNLNINKLSSYDKTQLLTADSNDIVAPIDQNDVADESVKYEKKIERLLLKKKIGLKTQDDLIVEQTKKYGKAIITPDFLLDQKIIINNKEVKWIEVKNFYGSNTNYFKKKIEKQLNRYQNKWGPGCIVFRYGISSELKFGNNLIISF